MEDFLRHSDLLPRVCDFSCCFCDERVTEVHAHLERLAFAQRRARFGPYERFRFAADPNDRPFDKRSSKRRRSPEANGELKPRALDLVIEIREGEVSNVAPEALKESWGGKLCAEYDAAASFMTMN